MALSDSDRKNLDSWVSPNAREAENAWIERLNDIVPLYMEHGFTKGEAATLFMLNAILSQVSSIRALIQADDDGWTP